MNKRINSAVVIIVVVLAFFFTELSRASPDPIL